MYTNPTILGPRAAFAQVAGLQTEQVFLIFNDVDFDLSTPVDWADYEAQPDMEIPDLANPNGPPLVTPQPPIRYPRDPWLWYQQEYGLTRGQPTTEEVAAVSPPEPEPAPPLTDVEMLAATIQARLDQRQLERTGVRPDPAGAVPRSRALAAAAMSLGGWGYPSEADLTGDAETMAILAALYADPTSNTTAKSSITSKRRAVQYVRIMAEGAAFGEEYSDALTAYERTASPGIQAAITADQRAWMALPCGPWESVKAMFLALLK